MRLSDYLRNDYDVFPQPLCIKVTFLQDDEVIEHFTVDAKMPQTIDTWKRGIDQLTQYKDTKCRASQVLSVEMMKKGNRIQKWNFKSSTFAYNGHNGNLLEERCKYYLQKYKSYMDLARNGPGQK